MSAILCQCFFLPSLSLFARLHCAAVLSYSPFFYQCASRCDYFLALTPLVFRIDPCATGPEQMPDES